MAMNLRLDEALNERLRQRAETENRSVAKVVNDAVTEYLDRQDSDETLRIARQGAEIYREALDRLGSA